LKSNFSRRNAIWQGTKV